MIALIACFLAFVSAASGKTYERCELARELKYAHGASDSQVATWVCIARHESQYNTSAIGSKNEDGSNDHGIFQISDKFWCSPPGKGWACGMTCALLEDDDIADDFVCANKIYKEHKYLQGDGFKAWVVYDIFCREPNVQEYIEGCFTENDLVTPHPKKKPTTKKVYPWLVMRSSTTGEGEKSSTCSDRIDIPPKSSTRTPTVTASRFGSIPPTTTRIVSTSSSFQTEKTLPTLSKRFETQTDRKFAFSLGQDGEPRSNQKRQSVFIINGRSWP